LAVQARVNSAAAGLLTVLDDPAARQAVDAERSFLRAISAGCHTPVGALATVNGASVSLHGQLFDDDGQRMVEGAEAGNDPESVGLRLARRLLRELKEQR
jgi:hydroxymethylbilane synthase